MAAENVVAHDEGPRGDAMTSSDATSDEPTVPSGNLFGTPNMTALDPADKHERRDVERLLEALDPVDHAR